VAADDLGRQLKNVKAERDKLVEFNRNLDDDLKASKEKAKAKEQQFKDTDRMLQETMQTNVEAAAAADAKIQRLEGDLALERKRAQDMLPDIEKYKALKKEFATLDAAHKKVQKEREALDKKLQQAEKERIKVSNARAAAVREKAEANALLRIANGDIDRLTKSEAALLSRVDVTDRGLLSLSQQLTDAEGRVYEAEQNCLRIEANLGQEEEEHASTRRKLEETEADLTQHISANEELTQRTAAVESEIGLLNNANDAKAQLLSNSLDAFTRERAELATMNNTLKEQLESLWAEIDKEMRDKSDISEKMMKIQEEFQLASTMLDKESAAHSMTTMAQVRSLNPKPRTLNPKPKP
jgi:chromosome segregation ATPase